MLSPAFLLLQLIGTPPDVYHGRNQELKARIPSQQVTVTIDGNLDEAAWGKAAVLTGFSMYRPVDQRPAPDSTEVLIWYSADAIYFGIRGYEPHGSVRATLAERDRIENDDNIEIDLDTFDERRRALVFIVNPLGVQADGTKLEGGGFIPGQPTFRQGQVDLSADFIWESKGRLTDYGYEVEIRIPFKSLRYPERMPQNWGIQIVRKVQHSGYELTWTPAKRGSASFIAQAGSLIELNRMRHGQVVEMNPEFTASVTGVGSDDAIGAREWSYDTQPTFGGNLKWGVTSNWVLNATVKPDFSQVEADALQIAGDARFALFYAEKRPFFVDGIEQFSVMNNLVYTRRIVRPIGAARLTGKVGRNDVAVLAALDDEQASISGDDKPAVALLRLQRSFGQQSTIGVLYSGREEPDGSNRLVDIDARIRFGGVYLLLLQGATSFTTTNRTNSGAAPLWEITLDRTGRRFGFHYTFYGVHDEFVAANGFVPRTGIVRPFLFNRVTTYGRPGWLLESWTARLTVEGNWNYDDFLAGNRMLESRISFDNDFTLRGGWSVTPSLGLSGYRFNNSSYANYATLQPTATGVDTVAFVPSERINTNLVGFRVATPQFRRFAASLNVRGASDVDFFETSKVRRDDVSAVIDWRPTPRLRVNGSYLSSSFRRSGDDERTLRARIPRVKIEYQVTRPLFVRFVGQYDARERAALRDPRTGQLLLRRTSTGYTTNTGSASNDLRVDWLLSYRPVPGTVFFAGYGSNLTEMDPLRFDSLQRVGDGFFVKLSYLMRR